jgi:hypothetical protein
MMKKLLVVLVFFGFAVSSFAEGVFDYGVDLRLRQEYFDNAFDFNDDSLIFKDDNFFRIKASLWGRWNFSDDVSLFTKLTSEPKIAVYSSGKMANNHNGWDEETFFDNLYLDVKNLFGAPLDLRLGRQDLLMTHGEGFVIMDGTPYDGSRSFYFNAARATWRINEKNSLDIIYVQNTAKDEYLPVINWQGRNVVICDEKAFILYGKFKTTDALSLEPYYIYKVEDSHNRPLVTGPVVPELRFNTVGNRAVYDFAPWRLRGELAYQFGKYSGSRDRDGIGGYVYLTRFFKDARFSPSLDVGYAYLSGEENYTTGDDGGWNPVFSKWPWISDLYLFAYSVERGEPAYWTNLQLWRAKLNMNLTEKTGLSLAYNYLRANEPQTTGAPFFGDGDERGQLAYAVLTQKFSKNINGSLYFEYFMPGDFYAPTNRDDAMFLRWELQMKF